MARRNRRADGPPAAGRRAGQAPRLLGTAQSPADRVDVLDGAPHYVRAVTGAAATKAYRCPGCDQLVPPATPHLLVWPVGSSGIDWRRHWHTPCWAARDRRRPAR
ncbi:hypothetical protein EV189_2508 [Motilibacter rhizosphaerae]|uniref:ATP/GTP-binding protein n=1 Tax=Motilibacter rhizosphaerae TaxID=598652 RepID=A0A4Q7NQ22_9ACTN|nr:hypothetical protein [Motilibacter rhizosphaerae]RZS87086.1 hypothetical protein EV189_2508 [Motilibacter rhizosphaerae]